MRRVVMIACAASLLLTVTIKSRTIRKIPTRTAFHALTSSAVSVKVSGDVLHPGIYEVSANSLADSVIILAEPARPLKHLTNAFAGRLLLNGSAVTLSQQVDGSHLLTVDQMTAAERLVLGIPLDISTMNEADFDRLPGIGPALAKRIVAYRQNNGGMLRVSDLAEIEGIGEKKYNKIQAFFQHP